MEVEAFMVVAVDSVVVVFGSDALCWCLAVVECGGGVWQWWCFGWCLMVCSGVL